MRSVRRSLVVRAALGWLALAVVGGGLVALIVVVGML